MVSMDWAETTAKRDKDHLSFGFGAAYSRDFMVLSNLYVMLPLFATRLASCTEGIQVSFVVCLIVRRAVPDLFDRNKILSGGDLSHYQMPHCIRVFFYFV